MHGSHQQVLGAGRPVGHGYIVILVIVRALSGDEGVQTRSGPNQGFSAPTPPQCRGPSGRGMRSKRHSQGRGRVTISSRHPAGRLLLSLSTTWESVGGREGGTAAIFFSYSSYMCAVEVPTRGTQLLRPRQDELPASRCNACVASCAMQALQQESSSPLTPPSRQ